VKRAIVASARLTVVLVDSSKIGREQTVRFADLHDIDVVVTDSGVERDDVEALERCGIEVVVA
jgi:DeoR family transcriptional regulator, fructose operon transcriptional repressor